jgi:nicotinamide riboside kinase
VYLLAGDEIPWVDDGTREFSDRRSWFQGRFREELTEKGIRYVELTGAIEQRLSRAIQIVDTVCQGIVAPTS